MTPISPSDSVKAPAGRPAGAVSVAELQESLLEFLKSLSHCNTQGLNALGHLEKMAPTDRPFSSKNAQVVRQVTDDLQKITALAPSVIKLQQKLQSYLPPKPDHPLVPPSSRRSAAASSENKRSHRDTRLEKPTQPSKRLAKESPLIQPQLPSGAQPAAISIEIGPGELPPPRAPGFSQSDQEKMERLQAASLKL